MYGGVGRLYEGCGEAVKIKKGCCLEGVGRLPGGCGDALRRIW